MLLCLLGFIINHSRMDWRTINPQDESVLKINIKVASRSFWVPSTLKTNHASKWWCLFNLLFYILHSLIRLQHSIHSRNAKNWLLQKRYRQKGTHWHYIHITYYHVNKLQTHLSYGHYHKYNNYYWSALHNSARLSNGQARAHLWTAVPICDIQYIQF